MGWKAGGKEELFIGPWGAGGGVREWGEGQGEEKGRQDGPEAMEKMHHSC